MVAKPIPPAEMQRRLKALEEHGGNVTAAADALGDIKRQTLQHTIKLASGQKIKGTSTLYKDGEEVMQWIKTREDAPSLEEIGVQVRAALDAYEPPTAFSEAPAHIDADLATVYPIADWHVGMLAWKKETQAADYDLKIAATTIKTAMTRLVGVTPNATQGVVLGLGDLLHSDGYTNRTARSAVPLDVDGRYPKILQAATDLLLFTIDLALQRHAKVLVRILPGNHDDESAIAVTLALSMYYRNNERVVVDSDAGRFWWWLWGKVFLGATHGDQAKMAELPLIMASRNPEAWGRAKFRHVHTGHIHQDKSLEKGAVTVEAHRSPIPPDSWHSGMGYGAGRAVSAITYHKDQGEVIRQKVVIT
jgi:hypothetical protein